MSRSKPATESVSLFPFLAVLICAMGALILLLLVITRDIRRDALNRSIAEAQRAVVDEPVAPAEPVQPLLDPNVMLENRIERLSRLRSGRAEELRSQLALWANAEQRVRATQASLEAAVEQLSQLGAEQRAAEDAELGKVPKLASVERQVADLESKRDRVRRGPAQVQSRYAFVPFDGVSGTTRRPILIECTEDGLRFLPEDVLLTARDLQGSSVGQNPALAGANALIDHWTRKGRVRGESPPYVLLVVRPSGSVAYHVARKLLTGLDESFGYELVEDGWLLELPDAEPDARVACRAAVDAALAQQRKQGGNSARGDCPEVELMVRQRDGRGFAAGADAAGSPEPLVAESHPRDGRRVPGSVDRVTAAEGPHPVTSPLEPVEPAGRDDGGFAAQHGGGRQVVDPGMSLTRGGVSANSGRTVVDNPFAATDHSRESTEHSPFEPGAMEGVAAESGGDKRSKVEDGGAGVGKAGRATEEQPSARTNAPIFSGGNEGQSGAQGARKWGIHGPRATIGFRRQVRIDAFADELRVAGDRIIPAGRGETREQLANDLIAALENEIRAWGRPPESFYWVPAVIFAVHPGGYQHYERAKGAFEEQGVATSVEHVLKNNEALQPEIAP